MKFRSPPFYGWVGGPPDALLFRGESNVEILLFAWYACRTWRPKLHCREVGINSRSELIVQSYLYRIVSELPLSNCIGRFAWRLPYNTFDTEWRFVKIWRRAPEIVLATIVPSNGGTNSNRFRRHKLFLSKILMISIKFFLWNWGCDL